MAIDKDKLGAYISSFQNAGIPKDPDETAIQRYKDEFPSDAMEQMMEAHASIFSPPVETNLDPNAEEVKTESADIQADPPQAQTEVFQEDAPQAEMLQEEVPVVEEEVENIEAISPDSKQFDLGIDPNSEMVYEQNKGFFDSVLSSADDEVMDLNLDPISLDESLIEEGEEINQESPFKNQPPPRIVEPVATESEPVETSEVVADETNSPVDETPLEEKNEPVQEMPEESFSPPVNEEPEQERKQTETVSSPPFEDRQSNEFDERPETYEDSTYSDEETEAALENYSERSRMILYKVFDENLLDENEKEVITRMIAGGNEQDVIRLVGTYLSRKSLLDRKKISQRDVRKIFSYSVLSLISFFILLGGYFFTRDYVNAYYFYSKGLKELSAEQFPQAEEDYNRGMNFFRSVKMSNRFAQKYEEFRRYDDALIKYMRSLDIDPKNLLTNTGLVELYYKRQEYDKSLNLVQSALKEYPGDLGLWFWLGRNYLVKGRGNDDFMKASKIFESLVGRSKGDDRLKFISFLTLAYAYLDDFKKARGVNQYLESQSSTYVNEEVHPQYYKYLLDYFRRNFYGKKTYNKEDQSKETQQTYTVYTLERLGKKMEDGLENKEDFYGDVAMWQILNKDYDKAKVLLEEGFKSIKNRDYQVNTKDMDLANGVLNFYLNNQEESVKSFQKVLETDANDPYANYYLGNINLTLLKDPERAVSYYTKAMEQWKDPEYKEYTDLLYKIGYSYYAMGKSKNNQEGEKDIYDSLYWFLKYSEKSPEDKPKISYIKGNIFLKLKNYDLAIVEYQSSLDSLAPFMSYYTERGGDVDEDVRNKLKILSDVYNNIGVADVSKYYISSDVNYKVKALNSFINSIDLKNDLNVLKGKPSVNFAMLSRTGGSYGPTNFTVSDEFETLALN